MAITFKIIIILSIIKPSFLSHTPETYHQLFQVYSKLCPQALNSSIPGCHRFSQKLSDIRDLLLEESMPGDDTEEDGEVNMDSLGNQIVESAINILDLTDETDDTTCVNFEKQVNSILSILSNMTKYFDDKEHSDNNYTILFSSASVLLTLLLVIQLYHCIRSCMNERKLRKDNRRIRSARTLYENLNQIHLEQRHRE